MSTLEPLTAASLQRMADLASAAIEGQGCTVLSQGLFLKEPPTEISSEVLARFAGGELEGDRWLAVPMQPGPSRGLLLWRAKEGEWDEKSRELLRGFAATCSERTELLESVHLDQVQDQITLLDREYNLLWMNAAAVKECRGFGVEPVIGVSIWELFPEALQTPFFKAWEKAFQSQKPEDFMEYYEPFDIWVSQWLVPRQEGLWIYSRNITEEKRSGTAFRRQETLYRAILDGSSSAIFVKDTQGRYLEANRKALEVFGLPREELIGRTAHEVFPEMVADALVHNDDEVLKTNAPVQIEELIVRGDRTWKFLSSKFPLDLEGETVVCNIAADITDRVQYERQIAMERERFSFILEGLHVGVWFCDLPFSTLQWDEKVKQHFGLAPQAEVTIDDFYSLIVPEDREPTRQAIQTAVSNRTTCDTIYRTLGPDGVLRWIRAIGRCDYDAQGEPIRFDGISLDISSQYSGSATGRRRRTLQESLKRDRPDSL